VLRLNWFGFLPFSLPIEDSDALTGKDLLVLPRVLHAFALAWLVAVCVPREAKWMRLAVFRWLAAAGRFSLQVFCVGLFLSWGVTAAFRLWPGAVWWLDPLLLLAGCAILLRFGLWMDRGRARATARSAAVGSVSG
jgi:OpgC protein